MATRKTPTRTGAKTAATAETRTTAPARRRASAATQPRGKSNALPAKVTSAAAPPAEVHAAAEAAPTGEARYRWIAHAAYLRAERRGFAPGQEIDDWLAAEAEFIAAFKTS
jgi:hypothetical protein